MKNLNKCTAKQFEYFKQENGRVQDYEYIQNDPTSNIINKAMEARSSMKSESIR